MNLTPQLKAAAIATAVYTATGIQPIIINRPGQPPLITFNRADSRKVNDFIQKSIETKSDVNIDFYPYIAPVIMNQLYFPIFLGLVGAVAVGYMIGKGNPF
jgi:hypothetical protein